MLKSFGEKVADVGTGADDGWRLLRVFMQEIYKVALWVPHIRNDVLFFSACRMQSAGTGCSIE